MEFCHVSLTSKNSRMNLRPLLTTISLNSRNDIVCLDTTQCVFWDGERKETRNIGSVPIRGVASGARGAHSGLKEE